MQTRSAAGQILKAAYEPITKEPVCKLLVYFDIRIRLHRKESQPVLTLRELTIDYLNTVFLNSCIGLLEQY